MSWFLYLIECADGSVYTGITTDVEARFARHANGTGARYTRSRKPRAILAAFPLADRSVASRAEYWVKRLTPARKRELASGLRSLDSVLPPDVAATREAPGARLGSSNGSSNGSSTGGWPGGLSGGSLGEAGRHARWTGDDCAADAPPDPSMVAGRRARAGRPRAVRPATGRAGPRMCAAA